jgi:hypothetical protein
MNTPPQSQFKLTPIDIGQSSFVGVRGTVFAVFAATFFSGCISPMFTRYPNLWVGNPRSEGQAYQQQDPFQDPDIGPDLGSRPRDFARPRTESRQAAEQRLFQGSPASPPYAPFAPNANPRGGLNRPAAVY